MPIFQSNATGRLAAISHDSLSIVVDFDRAPYGKASDAVQRAVHAAFSPVEKETRNLSVDEYETWLHDTVRSLAKVDSRNASNFVALFSGIVHEIRHGQDLLCTTFGQETLFLLLNCYQNIWTVLEALASWQKKNEGRSIPLPLKGYDHLLEGFDAEVAQLLQKFWNVCDRLTELEKPPVDTISGRSTACILEMLAVNTQLDFVYDVFGEKAHDELLQWIDSAPGGLVYVQTRNQARDIFMRHGFRDPELIAALDYLGWCALNGVIKRDGSKHYAMHPVVYFEALVEHVSRECGTGNSRDWKQSVDSYCSGRGFLTPSEVRNEYLQRIQKRIDAIPKLTEGETDQFPFQRPTINAFQKLALQYKPLTQMILHDSRAFSGRYFVWTMLTGHFPSIQITTRTNELETSFPSFGYPLLDHQQWSGLSLAAIAFRLLGNGRDSCGDTVGENAVLAILRESGWAGTPFRLRDMSDIFFD